MKTDSVLTITSTIEDYLESILVLSENKGFAQVTEIAKSLGVSKASVTEMIIKLKSNNLVYYEKYSTITLTEEGSKIALDVKERHEMINQFLKLIGVNEEDANYDCCIMEHDLSKDTVEKIKLFTKFLQENNQEDILKRFNEFIKKG